VLSGDINGLTLKVIKLGPNQAVYVVGENSSTIKNLRIVNGGISEVVTYQCLLVKNNDLKNPVSKSQLASLTIVKPGEW
jgi:hypothetical protein